MATSGQEDPLDVVVIRGQCTATAIGVAAKFAKAKATTVVLWDRRHKRSVRPNVSAALEQRVYQTMEEERPDALVMGRAFEFIGAGAPKCALLHVGSDKLETAKDLGKPLWHPQEVMKQCKDNHYETLQAFYASAIYQPWVHSLRACTFHILPPDMDADWPDDMCLAATATRRFVKYDGLRNVDSSGWTFGLQLVSHDPSQNAKLIFSAVNGCVRASETAKNELSGRMLQLLPTGRN